MRCIQAAIVGVVLLSTLSLPTVASERYPTQQELQKLAQEFKERLPKLQNDPTGIYHDRRTATQRQQTATFSKAWAKVDPGAAPFLGKWVAIEETISIYPSRTPGKVCVIETFIPDDKASGMSFSLGEVSGETIRTTDRLVLLRQGNFLASTFVYEQKPGLYEYGNPRPLDDPEKVSYFQRDPKIIQQFKQAGCIVALPK